jgi:hypothetical protein
VVSVSTALESVKVNVAVPEPVSSASSSVASTLTVGSSSSMVTVAAFSSSPMP